MHIHNYSHGLSFLLFHIAFALSFLYALCSHSVLKFSTEENDSTKTSKLIIQWNGNEALKLSFAGMENAMYLNMFLEEEEASSSSYFIQYYEMCCTNKTALNCLK